MARKDGKDRGILEKPPGSGQWWCRLFVDGREIARKCASKTQAKQVYIRLKEEARQGKLLPKANAAPSVPTLNDYWEQALRQLAIRGVKPSSIVGYQQRLKKRILPKFGFYRLDAIKRSMIKKWVCELTDEGLDYDTIAGGYYCTLSSVLSEAVEDEYLASNPLLRKKKILRRPSTLEEDELMCFTLEEQAAILRSVQQHQPTLYPMVLLLFRTGIRMGELIGLHCEDVDFRVREITIRRNFTHGHLGTPKNGRIRKVDMSRSLAAALKSWIEVQELEAAASQTPPSTVLFPGNLGGTRRERSYMAENYFRYKLWFPALDRANVRRLGPHACRHTFASTLIHHGESLKYISAQLGHASVSITADTYGHLFPTGDKRAVDRLDAIGMNTETGSKTGSEEKAAA
jgi:integrase